MSWRFGECELNCATRELTRGNRPVPLTPKAFRLLELLLERHPAAVHRQEIRDALWPDTVVSESNLASLVWEVRSAIGDAPRGRFLRTLRGFGYAFSGHAEPLGDATSAPAGGPRLVWGDRTLPLRAGENLVGRDRAAAVCLDAPSVSRYHAGIRVEGCEATLQDLDSKNGTRLNGEKVRGARKLRDGDAIRLGAVQVLFRSSPLGGSTATDASGADVGRTSR